MVVRWVAGALVPLALAMGGASALAAESYQSQAGSVSVVTVAEGLEQPWGLAFLPDGRMLVTEKEGRLRLVGVDGALSEPLGGVPQVHDGGQGGLLDVALDPDFASNRLVYLSFSEPGGGGAGTAVARGRLGDGALENVEVIWRQQPKLGSGQHFGSRLVFLGDGTLIVTLGDRNQRQYIPDMKAQIGKLVRINRDGSIPKDNPFVGENGKNEIFSRGLRNPFRFSFDKRKIVIGDVGQDRFEEVDFERLRRARGANFGWNNYEGNAIFQGPGLENHDRPIHTYSHSGGRCSITGGYVVRDKTLRGLKGRYVYGDLCTGQIRSLKPRLGGARNDSSTGLSRGGLVSFGTDSRKRVYVVAGGNVYRIVR
jgi:aldose sugar dehydrogenase